jgi:hypothetical protein
VFDLLQYKCPYLVEKPNSWNGHRSLECYQPGGGCLPEIAPACELQKETLKRRHTPTKEANADG